MTPCVVSFLASVVRPKAKLPLGFAWKNIVECATSRMAGSGVSLGEGGYGCRKEADCSNANSSRPGGCREASVMNRIQIDCAQMRETVSVNEAEQVNLEN